MWPGVLGSTQRPWPRDGLSSQRGDPESEKFVLSEWRLSLQEAMSPPGGGHVCGHSRWHRSPLGTQVRALTWLPALAPRLFLLGYCGFSCWRRRGIESLLKFESDVHGASTAVLFV